MLAELQGVLAREGVEAVEPVGERFDPTVHEALSTRPQDGADSSRRRALLVHAASAALKSSMPARSAAETSQPRSTGAHPHGARTLRAVSGEATSTSLVNERSSMNTCSADAVSAACSARRRRSPRVRVHSSLLALANLLAWLPFDTASAHGFAGKRFFPATLATDDPFVADELSLPTLASRRSGGDPATLEQRASIDVSKRISADVGIGFEATYLRLRPAGTAAQNGFDNFALNAKYQFYKSDEHETLLSLGADWDIGGSGAKRVGAESFSTLTPTLFFGKGFGDLPESARYLRPFAITGSAGIGIPTRARSTSVDDAGNPDVESHPNVLKVGFALEYSLPYLQTVVKDIGLGEPFKRVIPVVELALEKPLNRGGGPWVGTLNPGFLVPGRYMQFGLEAVVPVGKSGGKVGWIAQIHFFLDDLFPTTLGKPLLGR